MIVRDKPILFSAPMVRAIRRAVNPKTQTRRIMKTQPPEGVDVEVIRSFRDPDGRPHTYCAMTVGQGEDTMWWRLPYGVPGDRLWVKESHWRWTGVGNAPASFVASPDGDSYRSICYDDNAELPEFHRACVVRRVSSIHMWRWASRITLEATNLRVERVQDISEADALAEGFDKETCYDIFSRVAHRVRTKTGCYLLDEDGNDEQIECCQECAEKRKRQRPGLDIRFDDGETDSPRWCEDCHVLLDRGSLTEYGIATELYLEGDDPKNVPHFPAFGDDAVIARDFCHRVPDEHLGRLAKVGFATLWDLINGEGSWKSNPWVWVVDFREVKP